MGPYSRSLQLKVLTADDDSQGVRVLQVKGSGNVGQKLQVLSDVDEALRARHQNFAPRTELMCDYIALEWI